MKVVWNKTFLASYCGDPAATPGRMEPIVEALDGHVEWVNAEPAPEEPLLRCHTPGHLRRVKEAGLFEIATLAAGGALRAAQIALAEPAFALIRPPGHHASRDSAWGFCQLNNIAIALAELQAKGHIQKALVLDFDLHVGDGTINILGPEPWVEIVNPGAPTRSGYLLQIANALEGFEGDCIALSAGFDNHEQDWGGLLTTEDYERIGEHAAARAGRLGAACFAVLEGGYNHRVLGGAVRAFLRGIDHGWAKT
jgi:acetoin utilization deacetylase AcuC-like enzyme